MAGSLDVVAARKLSESAVAVRMLSESTNSSKSQLYAIREKVAALAAQKAKMDKQTDGHKYRCSRLMHSMNEMGQRFEHKAEELRLLLEECRNVEAKYNAVKSKLIDTALNGKMLEAETKEAERSWDVALVSLRRAQKGRRDAAAQLAQVKKKQQTADEELKRLRASAGRCWTTSARIQSILNDPAEPQQT